MPTVFAIACHPDDIEFVMAGTMLFLKDRGCDVHDLGYVFVESPALNEDGTLGPLVPTENFKGIYDFKKSFSADYHEFVGEYVLIGNKLKYYAYAQLMPRAKKALPMWRIS